jgi:hypothetical protein
MMPLMPNMNTRGIKSKRAWNCMAQPLRQPGGDPDKRPKGRGHDCPAKIDARGFNDDYGGQAGERRQ